jgi:prolyl oligopeptidase
MKLKAIAVSVLIPVAGMAQVHYPQTKKVDQKDNYHGVEVHDPYRWLEDDRSEETGEWVKAQNKVTDAYLNQISYRKQLQDRLEKVFNYPKYSAPFEKGGWYYYYKNDGLQNQSVLYRQKEINGKSEIVLDPNTLSQDGTTGLKQFSLDKDGKYAAYALSKGGSDWMDIFVMDMKTLKPLNDKVEWVKVSGIAWQGDGFYYSRYPKPEGSALAAKNENHQVWFHKVGTSQTEDKLVFEDAAQPQRFNMVYTLEDEKYAFLTVSDRGKGLDGNAIFFKEKGAEKFTPIVEEITNASFSVFHNVGNKFYVSSNHEAPNEKVVTYDAATKKWSDLIPEKQQPLQSVNAAGGKLFVSYLKDVSTHVYVFDLHGKLENEVALPGVGTAGGFGGKAKDKAVFYTFTSFTFPPTIYSYDIASKKSSLFRKPEVDFNSEDFETKQIFYASKDGTKVPMFITYKKGLKLDSKNPTLLYGYGGFNVSLYPSFSPLLIPFLEQGGVYAQANLRGGAEYGEAWHEQGMKLKKQNVFDDFIAAGEYLIAQKYCDSEHLALRGGSNGGLLVGAVINQRPDLAKVAIPQVGVMDMLRFQKFTIGWNWIADYGSAENAEEFKVLHGYSPLHNIKSGINYPATLVTTADHDDRVVPAHSFKYAAELQAKAGDSSKNPLLIRIDTNSGHGASNTKKNIELTADIYGFIFWNMGIKSLR